MSDAENMREQWLLDGDCRICRRQKYCTKGCRKNRIAQERLLNETITNAIIKRVLTKSKEVDE